MNLPLKPFIQNFGEMISPPSHRMTIISRAVGNMSGAGEFMRANEEDRKKYHKVTRFDSPYKVLLDQKATELITASAATLITKTTPEAVPVPSLTILDSPDTADLGIIEAMARETLAEEAQLAASQVTAYSELDLKRAAKVANLDMLRANARIQAMPAIDLIRGIDERTPKAA